jgi:hypothetical protein
LTEGTFDRVKFHEVFCKKIAPHLNPWWISWGLASRARLLKTFLESFKSNRKNRQMVDWEVSNGWLRSIA